MSLRIKLGNAEALHISSKDTELPLDSAQKWPIHGTLRAWSLVPASLLVWSLEWEGLSDSLTPHCEWAVTSPVRVVLPAALPAPASLAPSAVSAPSCLCVHGRSPEWGAARERGLQKRRRPQPLPRASTWFAFHVDRSQLCTHIAMRGGAAWRSSQ